MLAIDHKPDPGPHVTESTARASRLSEIIDAAYDAGTISRVEATIICTSPADYDERVAQLRLTGLVVAHASLTMGGRQSWASAERSDGIALELTLLDISPTTTHTLGSFRRPSAPVDHPGKRGRSCSCPSRSSSVCLVRLAVRSRWTQRCLVSSVWLSWRTT